MADDKSAARRRAKNAADGKTGPSKLGAAARAAANKLKGAKSAPDSSTGKHAGAPKQKNEDGLKPTPYGNTSKGKHSKEASGGKHHAPASQSAVKNAYGSETAPSKGRHSKESGNYKKAEASKPSKPSGSMSLKEAVSVRRNARKGKYGD